MWYRIWDKAITAFCVNDLGWSNTFSGGPSVTRLPKNATFPHRFPLVHAESLKPCQTLWGPMDCSPPGSSAHGISQARILQCVAISFSRASSRPRDWICISYIGRWVLYYWATREAQVCVYTILKCPFKQFSENNERPCKSYFLFEFCCYGQRFYHCFHNWMEVWFQENQLFFWDLGTVRYVLSFLHFKSG